MDVIIWSNYGLINHNHSICWIFLNEKKLVWCSIERIDRMKKSPKPLRGVINLECYTHYLWRNFVDYF